jgi:hypothetical protein
MTDLGGTPTEVAAISPEGHIYLKQPLSSDPKIVTNKGSHITASTRHLAGLVEIPDKLLEPGSARAWIGMVNGRPWLVSDLHPDNFIGDHQGEARINDPVIGLISMDVLKNVPGLGAIVQEAAKQSQQLGDRANRLFMSNKAVNRDASLQSGLLESSVPALHELYLNGTDARTQAATLLGRQDITRAATDSLYVSGTGDTGRSPQEASRIQKQRQQLLEFAYQAGLIMEGDKLTAWMAAHKIEPGREHLVSLDLDSNRVVKTVAVNAVKTVGDDGQMAPSTPYDYLTDHLFSNLLYDDDITLEEFFNVEGALHIVISQPFIDGPHSMPSHGKLPRPSKGQPLLFLINSKAVPARSTRCAPNIRETPLSSKTSPGRPSKQRTSPKPRPSWRRLSAAQANAPNATSSMKIPSMVIVMPCLTS